MAIGQRIKFFRNRKGMTQKQLGEILGFLGKTSDVRMSQYESEARVPKHDLVKEMASILDVSTHALTVPNIDTYTGLMHTLFALEDMYGLKIGEIDGEVCLRLDRSVTVPGSQLDTMFHAWQQQAVMRERDEISKEQYDEWRYKYPELDTYQHWAKVPSQAVSNMLLAELKGTAEKKQAKQKQTIKECLLMPSIETYYLIDFENVNEDGLSGAENLGSHDYVHLFFTKNASKISIEKLTSLNLANLTSHEIPNGNQSLDMHLVSYLGYLLGTNFNKNCKYLIISKDTDYDNIISFWKKQHNSDITRQSKIAVTHTKNPQKSISNKTSELNSSQRKIQLNSSIQQAISNAGYSQSTINKVASIVVKHFDENKFANNVHNELREIYTNYLDLYKIVKPIISQFSSTPTAKKENTSSKLNTEISDTLNKAGVKNDVIDYVTSLISKHHNEQNSKQIIYRSIIAKYGQKQGLNIYRHIKNKL